MARTSWSLFRRPTDLLPAIAGTSFSHQSNSKTIARQEVYQFIGGIQRALAKAEST
jgi:hypothetical protein